MSYTYGANYQRWQSKESAQKELGAHGTAGRVEETVNLHGRGQRPPGLFDHRGNVLPRSLLTTQFSERVARIQNAGPEGFLIPAIVYAQTTAHADFGRNAMAADMAQSRGGRDDSVDHADRAGSASNEDLEVMYARHGIHPRPGFADVAPTTADRIERGTSAAITHKRTTASVPAPVPMVEDPNNDYCRNSTDILVVNSAAPVSSARRPIADAPTTGNPVAGGNQVAEGMPNRRGQASVIALTGSAPTMVDLELMYASHGIHPRPGFANAASADYSTGASKAREVSDAHGYERSTVPATAPMRDGQDNVYRGNYGAVIVSRGHNVMVIQERYVPVNVEPRILQRNHFYVPPPSSDDTVAADVGQARRGSIGHSGSGHLASPTIDSLEAMYATHGIYSRPGLATIASFDHATASAAQDGSTAQAPVPNVDEQVNLNRGNSGVDNVPHVMDNQQRSVPVPIEEPRVLVNPLFVPPTNAEAALLQEVIEYMKSARHVDSLYEMKLKNANNPYDPITPLLAEVSVYGHLLRGEVANSTIYLSGSVPPILSVEWNGRQYGVPMTDVKGIQMIPGYEGKWWGERLPFRFGNLTIVAEEKGLVLPLTIADAIMKVHPSAISSLKIAGYDDDSSWHIKTAVERWCHVDYIPKKFVSVCRSTCLVFEECGHVGRPAPLLIHPSSHPLFAPWP